MNVIIEGANLLTGANLHMNTALGKGRPRSDAAECGVWSGSTLFAITRISIKNKMKKYSRHPKPKVKQEVDSSN